MKTIINQDEIALKEWFVRKYGQRPQPVGYNETDLLIHKEMGKKASEILDAMRKWDSMWKIAVEAALFRKRP